MFKGKPNKNKTVEIGYGILSSERNKGYATEAVKEIIKWLFSSEYVSKVTAECRNDNYLSIRVLEKLDMRRTGRGRNMLKWEKFK